MAKGTKEITSIRERRDQKSGTLKLPAKIVSFFSKICTVFVACGTSSTTTTTSNDCRSSNRELPLEIVMDVLKRLPAKSLMRFKCVSKQWYSLITDPYFAVMHDKGSYSRDDGVSLLYGPRKETSGHKKLIVVHTNDIKMSRRIMISTHYDEHSTPYAGTPSNEVHGLICLYKKNYILECVYLCNPTTHENLPLPLISPPVHSNVRTPFSIERRCGLGFDPINRIYKVLIISIAQSSHFLEKECYVFTVGDKENKWRQLDISNVYRCMGLGALDGIIQVDGFLYWNPELYCESSQSKGLISFDVEKEMFQLIEYPERKHFCRPFLTVGGQYITIVLWEAPELITMMRLIDIDDSFWARRFLKSCSLFDSQGYNFTRDGPKLSEGSPHSNQLASDRNYDVDAGEYMVLQLENVHGVLDSDYELISVRLVENIMPLKYL